MKLKRYLGQTDIEVSPIGLGVMQFSGGWGFVRFMYQELSTETKNKIVQVALDGGVDWFDTAEIYGLGRSERSLANALKVAGKTNTDVIIATKWFPLFRRAANISKTIDSRLRCLDGYNIELYQVHNPYSFSSTSAVMNNMADLVDKGKVRSIGVSNFSAENMRQAHGVLAKRGLPLVSNQVHYSLLNRIIESNGILDTARELGITIIAYSPLESGLLSGKFHNNSGALSNTPFFRRSRLNSQLERSRQLIDTLREIAQAHSVTPAQVALSWLINYHGEMVVAIPGASTADQAQQNAASMHLTLSTKETAKIDELSRQFRQKKL